MPSGWRGWEGFTGESDEERNEFIGWLSSNPLAGDVIPAAGGDMVLWWIYTKAKLDNSDLCSC